MQKFLSFFIYKYYITKFLIFQLLFDFVQIFSYNKASWKILKNLVPDIKIAVAHGQMPAKQLEDIIGDFADGNYEADLVTDEISPLSFLFGSDDD